MLLIKRLILNKNLYNSIIRIMENNICEIYRTVPANKIHQLNSNTDTRIFIKIVQSD
jgi:hypothetical protein